MKINKKELLRLKTLKLNAVNALEWTMQELKQFGFTDVDHFNAAIDLLHTLKRLNIKIASIETNNKKGDQK